MTATRTELVVTTQAAPYHPYAPLPYHPVALLLLFHKIHLRDWSRASIIVRRTLASGGQTRADSCGFTGGIFAAAPGMLAHRLSAVRLLNFLLSSGSLEMRWQVANTSVGKYPRHAESNRVAAAVGRVVTATS
jgi:hypothetical protein